MNKRSTMAWTEELGSWSRTMCDPQGKPDLVLMVYPDPADEAEPWTWEAMEAETSDHEPECGGALTLDAAKASAEQWGAIYRWDGQACCTRCGQFFDQFMSNGFRKGLCQMCFED